MNMKGVLTIVMLLLAATLIVLPVSGVFEVTGIDPGSGTNTKELVEVTLSGTELPTDAGVHLTLAGEPNITGELIKYGAGNTWISCVLNLEGKKAGVWNVIVVNNTDGSEATLAGKGFSVENLPPGISTVSPDTGLNNQADLLLTLKGTGFLKEPAVPAVSLTRGTATLIAHDVQWVSATQINCTVDLTSAAAGTWDIVVANYDGKSDTLAGQFTVANPPPTVSSILPSSGKNDDIIGITNLSGSNFMSGATVTLTKEGMKNITTINVPIVQPEKILCFFDLSGVPVGTWNVVVTNTDGQAGVLANGFSIFYKKAPTVTVITPEKGVNDAPVTLSISGDGFQPGAQVTLKAGPGMEIPGTNVTLIESSKITCDFATTSAMAGSWDLQVKNNDSQAFVLPGAFQLLNPAPVLEKIEPDSGLNNKTALQLLLSGKSLTNVSAVSLSRTGQPDINAIITPLSDGQVSCTVSLSGAEPGLWNVTLTNSDGQSDMLIEAFTVTSPAPEINSIVPPVGLNNGTVFFSNLAGAYFQPLAAVALTRDGEPDINAVNVTVENANKITGDFNLAGDKIGLWNLTVTNPDGQSVSAPGIFTIENPAPAVSAITPNSSVNNGPIFISNLSGTGFLPNASVQLIRSGQAPIQATNVRINATSLNCTFDLTGKLTGKWNVVVNNSDGKVSTQVVNFTIIPPPPVPDFTATPVHGTVPLTVHFSDHSTNTPYLWSWNFGDGFTVTGYDQQNPVHTYNEPGVYTVTLRAINAGGEVQIIKPDIISVVVTPVANFTAEPKTGSAPLLVKFIDASDGKPSKYYWDFGDQTTSLEKNPYHLYKSAGVYTVSLTVSTKEGSDTKTDQIEVTSVPVAAFAANTTSGMSPLTVQFTDLSTGQPTSWLWKFGDGGELTDQNPVHVFAQPGVYSVQLTAENNAGSSTVREDGYIVVGQVTNADFRYTPSNPGNMAPLLVSFTDRSTGKIWKWTWQFGDKTTSNEQNPTHYYADPGTYTVTLSVIGQSGSDSVTKTLVVNGQPAVDLNADFGYTPSNPDNFAPLLVAFTDQSTGKVVKWTWQFGDKTTSNEQNPTHYYADPGTYTVTLSIIGQSGSDSVTKTLVVATPPPKPDFIVEPTTGSVPLTVTLSDISTGDVTMRRWVIIEGVNWDQPTNIVLNRPGEKNEVYTFNKPGVYSVMLTVTDSHTKDYSKQKTGYITVLSFP
jgi:PKD repeat protein